MKATIAATPWLYQNEEYWAGRDAARDDGHYLALDDAGPPHGEDWLTTWWTRRCERYLLDQRVRG